MCEQCNELGFIMPHALKLQSMHCKHLKCVSILFKVDDQLAHGCSYKFPTDCLQMNAPEMHVDAPSEVARRTH